MSRTASLGWNANSEADLAGYKLYVGPASGTYNAVGSPKTFGLVTTGTFDVPAAGTWFFALTAFNNSSLESGFSNEISGVFTDVPTGGGRHGVVYMRKRQQ